LRFFMNCLLGSSLTKTKLQMKRVEKRECIGQQEAAPTSVTGLSPGPVRISGTPGTRARRRGRQKCGVQLGCERIARDR
jgi:hypothetical protein